MKKIFILTFILISITYFFSATILFDPNERPDDLVEEEIIFDKTDNIIINSIVTNIIVQSNTKNSFYFYHDFQYSTLQHSIIRNGFKVEEIRKTNTIRNPSRKNIIVLNLKDMPTKIDLSSSTGDIEVNNINISNFTGNTSTGKLNISSSTIQSLFSNSSTGNVDIRNSNINKIESNAQTSNINIVSSLINELNIKRSTGNIEIKDSILKGNVIINTSTGNVFFDQINLSEYTIYFESSTGTLNAPGVTLRKSGVYGSGSKIIRINTSTGNVRIK